MRTRPDLSASRRRGAALLAAAALALTTAAVPTLTARAAAPVAADPCPSSYPVAELLRGQAVTGQTVHEGTEPAPFTGTVKGVLTDGIAPGIDMVMVELTSPEIDRVGGIWAGMSGSPVYAADGRLIGAVAYGLALGPSPVAGVTPAEDMRALLSGGAAPSGAAPAEEVAIPPAQQRTMVASGTTTTAEAEEGFRQLAIPVGISGLRHSRLAAVNKLLGMDGVRFYRAPGGVSATATSTTPASEVIVPGRNLAASLSYGDLSAVGTGTTTMVCGDEAVGFGHPFSWSGPTTLTMHGADAVYVQEDPTLYPFKVSNPGAPVGTVDQDRLAGIKGVLDQLPDTATVTTVVNNASTGRSRTGVTRVSVPEFTPDAAAIGLLVNQDRVFDRIGNGSALVHFTISGTTADGEPFTLVRTNRYSSAWDISYQTIFELGGYAYDLLENPFTEVTFTDIDVTVTMQDEERSLRVSKVKVWRHGAWRTLAPDAVVRARAGATLRVRTVLTSTTVPSKTVTQRLVVPSARSGTRGRLEVAGAQEGYFEDEGGFPSEDVAPGSFAKLVSSLSNAPRNDQVTATLLVFRRDRLLTRRNRIGAGDVVLGSGAWRFVVR